MRERTEAVAVVAGTVQLHLVLLGSALKERHEELEQTHVFVRKLHRDKACLDHNVLRDLALPHRLAAENGRRALLLHDLRTETVLVQYVIHTA